MASVWAFGQFQPVFQLNVFVDISATFETKVQRWRCTRAKPGPFPILAHPRPCGPLRGGGGVWWARMRRRCLS